VVPKKEIKYVVEPKNEIADEKKKE